MSEPVSRICPGCAVRLVIRPNYRAPQITCPRCLTEVPNPLAGGPESRSCPRCQRPNPPEAGQCVACGERLGEAAASGPICQVCAEELPGHAANCPSRRIRSRPVVEIREAAEEAKGDEGSTEVLGWIIAFVCSGGVGATFGLGAAITLLLVLGAGLMSGKPSEAAGNVVRVVVYLCCAGAALFGLGILAVFMVCSMGR